MRALLRAHGHLTIGATAQTVGSAGARLLADSIERLRPARSAPRAEQLPYLVLKTCFVDGAKLRHAALKLEISERQLSRERARAISLLGERIGRTSLLPGFTSEQIPAVERFVARTAISELLEQLLQDHRLARVHGPPGIGKTSLVADLALREAVAQVWWHRFRKGVNDSLEAAMIDLGHWLAGHGLPELATYLAERARVDQRVASRIALEGLGRTSPLAVFDDFHHVGADSAIRLFLEEAMARLAGIRVVTISRLRPPDNECAVEIPELTLEETQSLLGGLGVRRPLDFIARVHLRTAGNPQLVKLSARWIADTPARDVDVVLARLGEHEDIQEFLLAHITELLDSDDRRVLQAAAIFRSRFSDDALAHVVELTRGSVQDASRRLVRSYVATRSARGAIALVHSIVRTYVYDRLDEDERKRLHLRAAAWYHRSGDAAETRYHRAAAGLEEP